MAAVTAPAPPEAAELDLVQLGRTMWGELPLMLLISLGATLACATTAVVALTVAPAAPAVAALTLGPVWMGAVAVSGRVLDGGAVGLREVGAVLRREAGTGVALAMVPAVAATLLIGTVGILGAYPDRRWLLVPIGLDATALAVVLLGCLGVFPLALVDRRRGRGRWLAALSLAGRDLTTTLGLAALVVLIALSVRLVGPLPALLSTGPLAMLCTAVTRRSVAREMGERDADGA